MIDFISYIYYKLDYKEAVSILAIQFSAIVIIHLFPLIAIGDVLFDFHIMDVVDNFVQHENAFVRRLVYIPILLSPIYIVVYILLNKNKDKILEKCRVFEDALDRDLKRRNIILFVYILCSAIFLIAGVSSSFWIPIVMGL